MRIARGDDFISIGPPFIFVSLGFCLIVKRKALAMG